MKTFAISLLIHLVILLSTFKMEVYKKKNKINKKKVTINFSFIEEKKVVDTQKSLNQKKEVWQKKAIEEVGKKEEKLFKEKLVEKKTIKNPVKKEIVKKEIVKELTKKREVEKIIKEKIVEKPLKEEIVEEVKEEIIKETREEVTKDKASIDEVVEEVEGKIVEEIEEEVTREQGSSIIDNLVESQQLIFGDNGDYIVKNQDVEGINYRILESPNPKYPSIAKKARIHKEIHIKVRFLVGYNGKVEEIKFLDNITKYGFRREVENALKQWQFSPVELEGKRVKMYFYKVFKFKTN